MIRRARIVRPRSKQANGTGLVIRNKGHPRKQSGEIMTVANQHGIIMLEQHIEQMCRVSYLFLLDEKKFSSMRIINKKYIFYTRSHSDCFVQDNKKILKDATVEYFQIFITSHIRSLIFDILLFHI